MDTPNDLQQVLHAIEQQAKEQGLHIVRCTRGLPSSSSLHLAWEGEWLDYLEVARLANVSLLYVQAEPFDLEQENRSFASGDRATRLRRLQAASEEEDEEEEETVTPSVAEADWLFQRFMEQTECWRSYQHQIGSIECLWVKEGVGHGLELDTEWYDAYIDAILNVLADAEAVALADRHVRSQEEAAAHLQRARQLAQHERFPEATNEDKRLYMAKQLFPDLPEYGSMGLRSVVSLARSVYWWDVAPAQQTAKEQQVRDLWAHGESIKNIAAQLGISETKVKAAIQARGSTTN
jgi:hypothetical protein